jgi:hypothetical protein
MPQYELDGVGDASGLHRGRDAADALRRATGDDALTVAPDADDAGWHAVARDGQPAGRIRDHAARMRFRRD